MSNRISARKADELVKSNLPKGVAQAPMQLAQECMDLSTKIQHMSEDYIFSNIFMEYVKLKDPELYKQARLVSETQIRLHTTIYNGATHNQLGGEE